MEWLGLDHGILYGLERARTDSSTWWISWVTFLGNWEIVVFLTLLASTLLFRANKKSIAKGLLLSLVLCTAITETTKRVVQRERPDIVSTAGDYKKSTSFSFPSGHSSCSMCLGVSFFLVLSQLGTPLGLRLAGLIVGLSYGVAVGFSRLYLGVHWPTDVVVGWLVGIFSAFLGAYLFRTRQI